MKFTERFSSDQLSALRRVAQELVRQGQEQRLEEEAFIERNRKRVVDSGQVTETITSA